MTNYPLDPTLLKWAEIVTACAVGYLIGFSIGVGKGYTVGRKHAPPMPLATGLRVIACSHCMEAAEQVSGEVMELERLVRQ